MGICRGLIKHIYRRRQMPEISVIVPIHNTKEYLKQCIESIINQTFKNLEIILVDDASSDGSELMCDDYAKKDIRIRVVHKKWGGGSGGS